MSENDEKIVENSWTDPATGKFKPGNPGKPKGTKHKPKFIDELDAMLDEMAEGKDYTYRMALKKKVLAKMIIEGDTRLLTEYWQQRDGKPKQPLVGGDEGDNPIIVKQVKYDGDNSAIPIPTEEIPAPITPSDTEPEV